MAVKVNRGRVLGVLSMTPLIDVVFLLLIFFLVATRLSREDQELDIPIPSAANAQPMTVEPQELIVNIDQDGSFFVNGEFLSESELEDVMRQSMVNNPIGQSVTIRTHQRVETQYLFDVIDICNKYGAAYSALTAEEEG
ncbi:MAG: biopolymer transporter ExbD [Planctomycetota bacterium]|nr:biopolymer transporter ExbD [Planctomycetota bacterium]